MNEGFIFLHRKICHWEWYKDSNTSRVFFHLLIKANHTSNKWRGIDIDRGQLITTIALLGEQLGLSAKNIRTALEHLKTTNEVAIKTTNKFSVITICKYDCYQSCVSKGGKPNGKQNGNQKANKRQLKGKQMATNNNNNNNDKNDNNVNTLSVKDRKRVKDVVDKYNSICDEMPKVLKITEQRIQNVLEFLSEIEQVQKTCTDLNPTTFFNKVGSLQYLQGENDRGWKANFDWILKNWLQIYEGNYD